MSGHRAAPIEEHFAAYDRSLQASGASEIHRSYTGRYLRRLAAECGFTRLADLQREALEDPARLQLSAHVLKGGVATFAARAAFEAALRLEKMGRGGDLSAAPEALAALAQEVERLRPALTALGEQAAAPPGAQRLIRPRSVCRTRLAAGLHRACAGRSRPAPASPACGPPAARRGRPQATPARAALARWRGAARRGRRPGLAATLWASILSALALPPWMAFMYSAWPSTKGASCSWPSSAS
jgi:hypothetical protein